MNKNQIILLSFILILLASSCVSLKKYQEKDNAFTECSRENAMLSAKNLEYLTANNELSAQNESLKKQNIRFISDSALTGGYLRDLTAKYEKLSGAYDTLLNQNLLLMKGGRQETQKLISDLEKTREQLLMQEDELKKLENQLNSKSEHLNQLQLELQAKEDKLSELQTILNKKDSAVSALRAKVSEALLGYENQGLSIVQKNGKVYVSMDESLLFASGKYEVSTSGKDALKKLAKVLESNTDINIVVEGHTDNVPYKGSEQLLDNWDLSVKRATTVVRILLSGSTIAPVRITAAGRSEYYPLDNANSPEARNKNRRTEIILTPKLDELFRIIETN